MKKIHILDDDHLERLRRNYEFHREERLQTHLSMLRIVFLHVSWALPVSVFIMRFFPLLRHYTEILNPIASHFGMLFIGIVIDRMDFSRKQI